MSYSFFFFHKEEKGEREYEICSDSIWPDLWMYANPFVFVACCAGKGVRSTSTSPSSVHLVWRYVKEITFDLALLDQSWSVDPLPEQHPAAWCQQAFRACVLHHNLVSWRAFSLKCRETTGGMLLCAKIYQSTLFLLQARSDFSTTLIAFFPFLSLSFLTLKKERERGSNLRRQRLASPTAQVWFVLAASSACFFPFFLPPRNPNRPCQSERSPKARHKADSFEPAEWSERLTPGQSGWLGAAAIGSIPALALSLFLQHLYFLLFLQRLSFLLSIRDWFIFRVFQVDGRLVNTSEFFRVPTMHELPPSSTSRRTKLFVTKMFSGDSALLQLRTNITNSYARLLVWHVGEEWGGGGGGI